MTRNWWFKARAAAVCAIVVAALAVPQREANAIASCYTDTYCIDSCGNVLGSFVSQCQNCSANVGCVADIGQGCTGGHLPGMPGEGYVYWCEYQS